MWDDDHHAGRTVPASPAQRVCPALQGEQRQVPAWRAQGMSVRGRTHACSVAGHGDRHPVGPSHARVCSGPPPACQAHPQTDASPHRHRHVLEWPAKRNACRRRGRCIPRKPQCRQCHRSSQPRQATMDEPESKDCSGAELSPCTAILRHWASTFPTPTGLLDAVSPALVRQGRLGAITEPVIPAKRRLKG